VVAAFNNLASGFTVAATHQNALDFRQFRLSAARVPFKQFDQGDL